MIKDVCMGVATACLAILTALAIVVANVAMQPATPSPSTAKPVIITSRVQEANNECMLLYKGKNNEPLYRVGHGAECL